MIAGDIYWEDGKKRQTARKVVYAGQICHQTRSFIGGLLGHQQVRFA